MISAERFLKEQGLQPASADTGGLALSSEDPERTNVLVSPSWLAGFTDDKYYNTDFNK